LIIHQQGITLFSILECLRDGVIPKETDDEVIHHDQLRDITMFDIGNFFNRINAGALTENAAYLELAENLIVSAKARRISQLYDDIIPLIQDELVLTLREGSGNIQYIKEQLEEYQAEVNIEF
jgi:hypothetical protein